MEMKRQKTLVAKGGSLVGWETTNNGLEWSLTPNSPIINKH